MVYEFFWDLWDLLGFNPRDRGHILGIQSLDVVSTLRGLTEKNFWLLRLCLILLLRKIFCLLR